MKICNYDIEVDTSSAFVGTLLGNKYNQHTYLEFIKFLKKQKDTIFVGFNSNDYKGYDLPQVIAFACVDKYRSIKVPKKSIPNLKKSLNNPTAYTDIESVKLALEISEDESYSLDELTELEICRLVNTLYFAYPHGNKQIHIPPEVKMGINSDRYKRMKKKIIDEPASDRRNYFFDLTDIYKSGSLKFLMSRHLGIEYQQTTNKTEKRYNITDLVGSGNLFKLKNPYNHAMAILSAQEYFNIKNPVLNAQVLVSTFLYKVIGEVDVDKIIINSINKIRAVDESFASKLDYLVDNKANIPHTINLKNTTLTVPLTRGGIHWGQKQYYLTPEKMEQRARDDYHYYNIDFASFYPSTYIQNKMFGKSGTKILQTMKDDRVKLKKTNYAMADGLKLILNILYGITGKDGKSLFLTSICQYLLVELVELLDGMCDLVEVVDMNTDGIIVCTKGELSLDDFYLHSKLDGKGFLTYEEESNYKLEVTKLDKLLFYKDYNNYIHSFKAGGAWISDANINYCANMPKFQQLIERIFGLSDEPITDDLFRLIFKGDKLDWYEESNDLSYAYPTTMWLDSNEQPTYHCYSYKDLKEEHISNAITQETKDSICNFIKTNFGKCTKEVASQIENLDVTLRTQGTHKLVPIKYSKAKGYHGEYAWIDELDLGVLSKILNTIEFNELIMMAIEAKKAKPKYFKDLNTEELFYIDKTGLHRLQ